ncbi:MAG: MBL fold metallo-hydrolase [Nitrospirota bacterium]|nr:MBL fold metallo-hydrolase [Nitrospirota bacterium]
MQIETVIVGQLDTNCYVVFDEENREAMVIDPGDEPDKIRTYIDANNLRPTHIIFTHAYYDHVCAVRELKENYQARIVMHEAEAQTYEETKKRCMSWGYDADDFPPPDLSVKEGSEVRVGKASFSVIHTPGHTPGGICLYGENLLFAGDTLFRGSVGRTDLPGGSIEHLRQSLKKLARLDPSTRVLCGHEEETTIGLEIRSNPFMHSL